MTVTARGIDYAWQHPDPAAIAAAGYTFACRYLSRDPSKNITLGEAQALAAHGIWCVANWEYGAQDMLRGYAGGIADAQAALAQAKAAGMPDGRPIYFSADWDVTPAQEATVLAYLSGAASVLGHERVGEYGGYYPVKTARDSGTVWTWQTFGWSGGQWDTRDTVRQTGSATVGGVEVDVNEAQVADYGQWQPGRLPDTVEADMPLTQADIAAIFNYAFKRQGNAPAGETTLGGLVAWNDGHVQAILNQLAAIQKSVAAAATPVLDADALAAKLAANPAFISALASAVAAKAPTSYTVTPAPGVTTTAK